MDSRLAIINIQLGVVANFLKKLFLVILGNAGRVFGSGVLVGEHMRASMRVEVFGGVFVSSKLHCPELVPLPG